MDRANFANEAPGKLIPVNIPQEDWAFIPHELPPDWTFSVDSNEIWLLLCEAKESLGRLDGIGQTLHDPQLLLRPLGGREALTSSSLEGTYVTPHELLFFELDPTAHTSSKSSEWREVSNYGRAMQHGMERLEKLPICLRVIKEIHEILLSGVRGGRATPGKFRRWQVQIGSDARFVPPPANYIDQLMANLELYMQFRDERYDPLVQAFIIHYQFEAIHPFADGNGRVGRVLLALMVYKWLKLSNPWLYMSAFYERFKNEYFGGLYDISARGDWSGWIKYCLRGVIWQTKDAIRRCNKLNALKEEYKRKVTQRSSRSDPIIDDLFRHPLVTAPSVAAKHGVTQPTARSDIKKLVEAGILKPLKGTRPKAFYAEQIFVIAYGEAEQIND